MIEGRLCENSLLYNFLQIICIIEIIFLTLQKDYYGMTDSITIFHGSNVVVELDSIVFEKSYSL